MVCPLFVGRLPKFMDQIFLILKATIATIIYCKIRIPLSLSARISDPNVMTLKQRKLLKAKKKFPWFANASDERKLNSEDRGIVRK